MVGSKSILKCIFFCFLLLGCEQESSSSGQLQEVPLEKPFEEADLVRFLPSDPKAEGMPVVAFESVRQDFGQVVEGELVGSYFVLENKGTAPLLIKDVNASCGCTTPDWPEYPIGVGQRDTVFVRFNTTDRIGDQQKLITLYTNAKPVAYRLLLEGTVLVQDEITD